MEASDRPSGGAVAWGPRRAHDGWWAERARGGAGRSPDPAEERPPDPEPVALQAWSQSPDLGAFVSTSAFHESFRPSCQVSRKGEQTAPSQLRGRTGFSEDLLKGWRMGVGVPSGVTCAGEEGPVVPATAGGGFFVFFFLKDRE